jgi:phenylacetate-coenzyme A ligase PaaK-like adenylate-forming protein
LLKPLNLSAEISTSVFSITGDESFEKAALDIFRFQVRSCGVYKEMSRILGVDPEKITSVFEIPFLPVSFFRDHKIISCDERNVQKIFTSSGTTGSVPSRHFISDLKLYEESFLRSFRAFYGEPGNFRFLALLPGYLERHNSSLVYMMDHLIRCSQANGSGFYLNETEELYRKLKESGQGKARTILFGASYALLDFAEKYPDDYSDIIVMETGGMKGRKKEMIREELHGFLQEKLNVDVIHSEYGMTELLSQAYSKGKGFFRTPPWMKILIRDTNDPLNYLPAGQTGGISIIDLANFYSCSFIATQDLGRAHEDGSFEVLGRFDDSDIRGCNLLVV